jgi:hypothetical protein
MAHGYFVDNVVEKIKVVIPVNVEDYDGSREWFRLESDDLSDHDLYAALRPKWFQILGPNYGRFALLYCLHYPNPGVWLHSFAAADNPAQYSPGCFQVVSWG